MKISDLDEVTELVNERRRLIELIRPAEEGHLNCEVIHEGDRIDVLSVIVADVQIREAIVIACNERIAKINDRLQELGVD